MVTPLPITDVAAIISGLVEGAAPGEVCTGWGNTRKVGGMVAPMPVGCGVVITGPVPACATPGCRNQVNGRLTGVAVVSPGCKSGGAGPCTGMVCAVTAWVGAAWVA